MAKVKAGDVGTIIRVNTYVNLDGASATELEVMKPDGTTDTWVGTQDPGNATKILYTTVLNDIPSDLPGDYQIEAHVEKGAFSGNGKKCTLKVDEKLIP